MTSGRSPGLRRWLGSILLAAALAGGLASCGDDDTIEMAEAAAEREADHSFTIPLGAGEAIDAGEDIEILPAELALQVGQVLEIVNLDDRGHLVGPFFVGEGETFRQEFVSAGTFQGICSVHPSGQFTLTVT